jgi:hypothetical protein
VHAGVEPGDIEKLIDGELEAMRASLWTDDRPRTKCASTAIRTPYSAGAVAETPAT